MGILCMHVQMMGDPSLSLYPESGLSKSTIGGLFHTAHTFRPSFIAIQMLSQSRHFARLNIVSSIFTKALTVLLLNINVMKLSNTSMAATLERLRVFGAFYTL